MPGITGRTALFSRLGNGRLRRLEFNLVNTSLGTMVEPNQSIPGFGVGAGSPSIVGDTPADGLSDNAFDEFLIVNETEITGQLMTSGLQTPRLW